MMRKVTLVLAVGILLMMGMASFAQSDGLEDFDGGGPSPVPEPATIVLMGAGLAAVAYAGWRRNRKK